MPVHSNSYDLARLIATREGSDVLNLCTGSGVHTLVASSRADHVVAVDIDPEAVPLARF